MDIASSTDLPLNGVNTTKQKRVPRKRSAAAKLKENERRRLRRLEMKSTEAAYDQRLKDNERQRLRRLEIKSTEAGEQHLKERRRKYLNNEKESKRKKQLEQTEEEKRVDEESLKAKVERQRAKLEKTGDATKEVSSESESITEEFSDETMDMAQQMHEENGDTFQEASYESESITEEFSNETMDMAQQMHEENGDTFQEASCESASITEEIKEKRAPRKKSAAAKLKENERRRLRRLEMKSTEEGRQQLTEIGRKAYDRAKARMEGNNLEAAGDASRELSSESENATEETTKEKRVPQNKSDTARLKKNERNRLRRLEMKSTEEGLQYLKEQRRKTHIKEKESKRKKQLEKEAGQTEEEKQIDQENMRAQYREVRRNYSLKLKSTPEGRSKLHEINRKCYQRAKRAKARMEGKNFDPKTNKRANLEKDCQQTMEPAQRKKLKETGATNEEISTEGENSTVKKTRKKTPATETTNTRVKSQAGAAMKTQSSAQASSNRQLRSPSPPWPSNWDPRLRYE